MPLCFTHQRRRTGLALGTALLITVVGAPFTIRAQQFDTSSSSSSSSNESDNLNPPAVSLATASFSAHELPDSPGYLLQSQTPQTTPSPTIVQTTNPDAVSPNGNQQTKRVLGLVPNFRSVSAHIKLPPM